MTMDSTVRSNTASLYNAIGLDLVDYKMERFSHKISQSNSPVFRQQFQVLQRKLEDLKAIAHAWGTLMAYRGQLISQSEVKGLSQQKDEILNMLGYLEARLPVRNDDIYQNDPYSSSSFSSVTTPSPNITSTSSSSTSGHRARSPLETVPPETPQRNRLEQFADPNSCYNTPSSRSIPPNSPRSTYSD